MRGYDILIYVTVVWTSTVEKNIYLGYKFHFTIGGFALNVYGEWAKRIY